MDNDALTGMLHTIVVLKDRAIKGMKYELAGKLRDVEKTLLDEIYENEKRDEVPIYDFKFKSPEEFEFVLDYISRVDPDSYKKLLEAFKRRVE